MFVTLQRIVVFGRLCDCDRVARRTLIEGAGAGLVVAAGICDIAPARSENSNPLTPLRGEIGCSKQKSEQPFINLPDGFGNELFIRPFHIGRFTCGRFLMNKICYVIAALATIAVAAPAVAEDKPMGEGMHHRMHHMHHRMEMHHHHAMKPMMDKKM